MPVAQARVFSPDLLRARRLAAGLSQARLSHLAGLMSNTVSIIECRGTVPLASTLGGLADALGCATDDFYGREPVA